MPIVDGLLAWPAPEGLAGYPMTDATPRQFGPRLWQALQLYRDDLPRFLADVRAWPPRPHEDAPEWVYVVSPQQRMLGVWRQTETTMAVLDNYPVDGAE